jgi:AcrR family transcriptional regulator
MSSADCHRRRSILEAAERLLRHYGPSKTTIAEIAREAAVGVGTVYLEFDSKDAIIDALSSMRHASVLDAMRAAAAEPHPHHAERLRAVLDARVRAFLRVADEGAHAQDLVHCASTAVRTAWARFQAEEHALLAALLREAAAAGEFDLDDAEHTALALLRAYASCSPPGVYYQPRGEVLAVLPRLHHLVLFGLVRRAGRNGRR